MKKYVPKLKQLIHVGGCVGKVVEITDTHIIVAGFYHHIEDNGKHSWRDPWVFRYKLDDLAIT